MCPVQSVNDVTGLHHPGLPPQGGKEKTGTPVIQRESYSRLEGARGKPEPRRFNGKPPPPLRGRIEVGGYRLTVLLRVLQPRRADHLLPLRRFGFDES